MFKVLTCLLIAMAIRPHDNGVLDIVMSFHNEVVPVICHHLLLILPSLMAVSYTHLTLPTICSV